MRGELEGHIALGSELERAPKSYETNFGDGDISVSFGGKYDSEASNDTQQQGGKWLIPVYVCL